MNFVDLFCGAGGLSCGLEMAGHKCLLGVDFNKDAIETFRRNHPLASAIQGDISGLTNSAIAQGVGLEVVDMVVGGPPCQGFSTIGKGAANDKRNQLFLEFVRIVKFLNPKIVIFENVTGLLAKKNAKVLKAIFAQFEKLGYSMDARVLNARHFGVAQMRKRVIIIGTKKVGAPNFPRITHGIEVGKNYFMVGDAFAPIGRTECPKNHNVKDAEIKNSLDKKRLRLIPEGCGVRYKEDEENYWPKSLRYGHDWAALKEGRLREARYQRLHRQRPSFTIMTSKNSYYHPTLDRHLTAREAACIQGFPMEFEFFGSVTSQFKQIGNAVPPLLGYNLGLVAGEILAMPCPVEKFVRNIDFEFAAFDYRQDPGGVR